MNRPHMTLAGPVLDAADPVALAGFYQRLLGWDLVESEGPRPGYPPQDGWAKIRSPENDLKMEFQWEEHYVPPTWPSASGEQSMMIHLDIEVGKLEEGVSWALQQGARLADHQPQEGVWVMLDPEGHPFCLFAVPALPGSF